MATNEVPGANPANGDELAMGCWAESPDGSLLRVESTENGEIIYVVFDTAKARPIEYRDIMGEQEFKRRYTAPPRGDSVIEWKWHDKIAFPWHTVIKRGAEDGARYASADDLIDDARDIQESRARLQRTREDETDAAMIARMRRLTGREITEADLRRRSQQGTSRETRRLALGIARLLEEHFGDRL